MIIHGAIIMECKLCVSVLTFCRPVIVLTTLIFLFILFYLFTIHLLLAKETFLQDFLENLEDMFPLYYICSDVWCRFKSSITLNVTRRERVNNYSLHVPGLKWIFLVWFQDVLFCRITNIVLLNSRHLFRSFLRFWNIQQFRKSKRHVL